MGVQDAKKRKDQWEVLLDQKAYHELCSSLQEGPIVEVVDFLSQQPFETSIAIFTQLEKGIQADLFAAFPERQKQRLYEALPVRSVAAFFVAMPSDQRVDFYQQLTDPQRARLLPFLPKQVKQDVLTLNAYPIDTAGGIMSTDFTTLREDMTAQEALHHIRQESPAKKMLFYLYVVDEEMKMLGFLSLKDLVVCPANTRVADLLHDSFTFAIVEEDRETVAKKIEKYGLVALPVLNHNQQLVGIVSHDDAMDVIREEETEDMERFMGIVSEEPHESYLHTSIQSHFRGRIGWIATLFIVSFISGSIIHGFHGLLNKYAILAYYLTTLNDAGGNAGSQTATVVIRSLALGQIKIKDWFKILCKELTIGLMIASCLFGLGYLKVFLLEGGAAQVDGHPLYWIALTISFALFLQVITATFVGAMLPLLIQLLKGDPALAASPAITTLVDITGMLIYFTTAYYLLG